MVCFSMPRSPLGDIISRPSLLLESLKFRLGARIVICSFAFFGAITGLCSPFFQKVFIDRLIGDSVVLERIHSISWLAWMTTLNPLFLIVAAFVATLMTQMFAILGNYGGIREGVFVQRLFSERLYKKALSMKTDDLKGTSVGEVVSLYATDVPGSTAIIDQAVPTGAAVVFPLILAPIAIHWICGVPLWATSSVMGIMCVFSYLLSRRQARFFLRFKMLAAERTGIVNEWVQNIRLLRILGWTETFESKIFAKREEETRNRVSMVTNGQLMNSFGSSISFVINLIGIASLVTIRGSDISAGELFALLWIFGVFLVRPFRQLPWIFTFAFDSLSSLKRLEDFLERPSELLDFAERPPPATNPANNPQLRSLALEVRGLNLEIGGEKLLDAVDLVVKPGEFVAIVGEVGSGKTLSLLSLVGETAAKFDVFKIGGEDVTAWSVEKRRRRFSFIAQDGFVMSASLRQNILFSYSDDRSKDPAVLRALELAQFRLRGEHLSNGLETLIGERGVNLSGGQKQRVALARAQYLGRPIVLMDDCLSAVDVDTERRLIAELIDGDWKDQTRILVTHRLSILEKVDRVLFIENGRITEEGRFSEIMNKSERVREFAASQRRVSGQAEAHLP
jgi:ATP-binding cassette subfamily B multidrug efflux pump